ncbi:hypothetical protein A5881_003897 [Enterococcus termitis]|nr:hypothetical protein A5881_003917 [Enterococcus termitis]
MGQIELFSATEKENYIVTKSNELIREAKHSLNAKELTLIDFMIAQIRQNDNELNEIVISIAALNKICKFGEGGAAYSSTMDALLSLSNKGFWFENPSGSKSIYRWLDKATVESGIARLQLDKDLAPHLLGLIKGGKYTQFYFIDVANLKSLFAKALYEELRSYSPQKIIEITTQRVRELFHKEDLEWYRVLPYLRKAKKDINEKTFMSLDYETIKQGKTTVAVRFSIEKKEGEVITENIQIT